MKPPGKRLGHCDQTKSVQDHGNSQSKHDKRIMPRNESIGVLLAQIPDRECRSICRTTKVFTQMVERIEPQVRPTREENDECRGTPENEWHDGILFPTPKRPANEGNEN